MALWRFVAAAGVSALLGLATAEAGERPVERDSSALAEVLLTRLLDLEEISTSELTCLVEDAGGVLFQTPAQIDFLTYEGLKTYLGEVIESEYPPRRAEADSRTLTAFDLLPPDTDLRALRRKLLEQNIAGFYDERPGRRRLYAVSEDRRLTALNQLILAHELRHALQDQYATVHGLLPASIGDFDDRRLALMALLEGDATLVMARFLERRLKDAGQEIPELSEFSMPVVPMPGAPDVLRDQMELPYSIGLTFVRDLWRRGGWEAIREAWTRPPESTEQVLHPESYRARRRPVMPIIAYAPEAGSRLNEGVLGEAFARTLLGSADASAAAAGWLGDRYEVWDLSGRTLMLWRSRWKNNARAKAFRGALAARYARSHSAAGTDKDWAIVRKKDWTLAHARRGEEVWIVSSDDRKAFSEALRWLSRN
jgi:hypothetical protein